MRDFRMIRKFEVDWKNAERQREDNKASLGASLPQNQRGGGLNLEDLMDELAEEG